MAAFLVELYVSQRDSATVERRGERARLVAEELTRQGTPVRYVRSIFVPEDETCFYLYEASNAYDVAERPQDGPACRSRHRGDQRMTGMTEEGERQ